MSYFSPKIKSVIGQTIQIYHPEEVEGSLRTYLSADEAASQTTISVIDSAGFTDNDIVRIGEYGNKLCEIKDNTAAPSNNTSITVTATAFAHTKGTSITKILYDQIEISGSSSLTGSKTVIATITIRVNEGLTTYTTSTAYAYYFVRYYNSYATTPFYSSYSDGVPASDYSLNTVAGLKKVATEEINVQISIDQNDLINHGFLDRQINLCLLDIQGKRNRWSWLSMTNYDLGNLSYVLRRIAMPSDIYDDNTNRSVESLRIGDGKVLTWIPWSEYLELMEDVAYTTVATAALSGATSLVGTDTVDFDSTGSLDIGSQTASISYTANSSNTFTVDSGDITADVSADEDIWQGVNKGTPTHYTVTDGYIYFYPVPDSNWTTQNIYLDYYTVVTQIDSDGDTVEPIRYDAVRYWLQAAILRRKKQYEEAKTYDKKYEASLVDMIQKERSKNIYKFRPAVSSIIRSTNEDSNATKRD